MTQEIKLGMIVRDPVTGLTGTADAKYEMLSGSVQFKVQPLGEGAKVEEGYFIDDFLLEVLGEGVSDRLTPADDTVTLRLGEQVQDTVSGVKGIATAKVTYLNGCVYFSMMPKAPWYAMASVPDVLTIDHKRLKKIGEGLAPKVTAPVVSEQLCRHVASLGDAPAPKKTGGPNRSARSVRIS